MGPAEVKIEVVYASAPHQVDLVTLDLPQGATVREALEASGLPQRHEGLLDPALHRVGVWGRLAGLDQALRDRDRVEIYRPLTVDPKEARRLRYRKQPRKPRRTA
jgi:putative ubiquitin-RnfH superfamily antitoxin RatB of RatAB toxin-antitoxin module